MSGIILLIQNSPVITKLIGNLKFNWTHHLCDRECWLFFASRISSPLTNGFQHFVIKITTFLSIFFLQHLYIYDDINAPLQ